MLRAIDSCTVANAIEFAGIRLRNTGYMSSAVACVFPEKVPLVGHAFTLVVKTSDPPLKGFSYIDRTDWWDQLLSIPEPRVLVAEDREAHAGTGSLLGEVHANVYKALGCAGMITNGAVRDLPALGKMSFQVFASHVSVSHAYAHIVEVGKPVTVGGLEVRTGDLIHGDMHGVISIPWQCISQLPVLAAQQKQREKIIIDYCKSAERTVEGLRRILLGKS